jgi:hypothetical protein
MSPFSHSFVPWDEWTCAFIASKGELEVLKWLRENECPWNWRTCAAAFEKGHKEVLMWAQQNGFLHLVCWLMRWALSISAITSIRGETSIKHFPLCPFLLSPLHQQYTSSHKPCISS